MEEYIRKLLEQVRFQKAHKAIEDEIRLHIEDQTEAYLSDGMDKETAEKRAVRDMGDPVEAGISLDSVHRPQMAWDLVVAAFAVALIGIMIHIYMSEQLNWGMYISIFGGHLVKESTAFILYSGLGMLVMLLLYFMDYTTFAKYSTVVGSIFLILSLCSYWICMMDFVSEESAVFQFLYGLDDCTCSLMFLMIPIYAGILYKYRGQKYGGLIKAIIWIAAVIAMSSFYHGEYSYEAQISVTICMLVQLTIAINREWIKVHKIPVLIFIWSLLAIPSIPFIWLFKEYDFWEEKEIVRPIISSARLFGRGKVSGDSVDCVEDRGVLTYISTTMGIGIAIAVLVVILSLIVYGLIVIAKTKNQLGGVMGIGCMIWLIEEVIINVVYGFGLFCIDQSSTFLPFISGGYAYDRLIISYAMFGIILSIYKYKDAYAEHVDIRIRNNSKELGV